MKLFLKYFVVALVFQMVFVAFSLAMDRLFGVVIGMPILFFLYALPWVIAFPQGFSGSHDLGILSFFIGAFIPGLVYSAVVAGSLCLLFSILRRGKPELP